MNWNLDGALIDAFSAIANPLTGLGTERDKSTYVTPNLLTKELSRFQLESLFRNDKLIEKVVCAYPKDATRKWGEWSVDGVDPAAIASYEKRLGLRSVFMEAGMMGRLYGDAFVLLGIDDGQDAAEPVNEKAIASIKFAKALSRWQLQPDITASIEDPEYFMLTLGNRRLPEEETYRRIHKSRVLRFPGKWLPYEMLHQHGGYHDSVVQVFIDAFMRYSTGIGASSAMLNDYSVFVYKMKGLRNTLEAAGAIQSDRVEVSKSPTAKLLERFRAIQMGMSIIKGLMIDADTEDANFISRQYGGVKDIIEQLQDALVAASDMPRAKLFGSSKSGAFSEAGKSDRYEWASLVNTYQSDKFQPHLERMGRLIIQSRDFTGGTWRDQDVGFNWESTLELTDEEVAQLRYQNAQTDSVYVGLQVLTPEEIRESRFGGGKYGKEITLLQAAVPQPASEDAPDGEEQQEPPEPDLAALREDALAGLIPRSHYWEARGLDPQQILAEEERERQQAIAPPPVRWY